MIHICRHCLQSKSGSVQLVLLNNCQLVARLDRNNEDTLPISVSSVHDACGRDTKWDLLT